MKTIKIIFSTIALLCIITISTLFYIFDAEHPQTKTAQDTDHINSTAVIEQEPAASSESNTPPKEAPITNPLPTPRIIQKMSKTQTTEEQKMTEEFSTHYGIQLYQENPETGTLLINNIVHMSFDQIWAQFSPNDLDKAQELFTLSTEASLPQTLADEASFLLNQYFLYQTEIANESIQDTGFLDDEIDTDSMDQLHNQQLEKMEALQHRLFGKKIAKDLFGDEMALARLNARMMQDYHNEDLSNEEKREYIDEYIQVMSEKMKVLESQLPN